MEKDFSDIYEKAFLSYSTSFIESKTGCSAETLRHWIQKDEIDNGKREGLMTSEREHMKQLEKENRELKRPTKYFGWLQHISRRRSSTANSGNRRAH